MEPAVAHLIRFNDDQVVELPDEVAFPDDVTAVRITVVGDARLIVPTGIRTKLSRAGTTT